MRARISKIIKETARASSFQLQAEQRFDHQPGQWMYVNITENLKHHFTISSSPTEDFVQFTTLFREESEYKRSLFNLPEGSVVDIRGPFGNFCLNSAEKSLHLFLTGGIGITPFRSMIKYVVDKQLHTPIVLVYSVKTKADIIFADWLSGLSESIKVQIVETSVSGRLDESKIKFLVPDWDNRTWWICGPPSLVVGLVELGQKMNLPSDKIRTEEFTGY